MKTIICEELGKAEGLKLIEQDKPKPMEDEVVIKNYASSINTLDILYRGGNSQKKTFWFFRVLLSPLFKFYMVGFRKPKRLVPGFDFAGEIVDIGSSVMNWKIGDQVFGYSVKHGTLSEYVAISANRLALKPINLSFQESAAIPGGAPPAMVGLLDLVKLQKGQKVMVIGATSGIGSFAVQIAKNVFETEVTAVCGPSGIDVVKKMGVNNIIDYSKGDYTKNKEMKFDVIFDAIGANTFSRCKKILTENGVFVTNNFANSKRHLLQMITTKFGKKKLKFGIAKGTSEVMNQLKEWVESGKVKPIVDSIYPLEKASLAHKRYETGHAKGRVVISIN
jgi:NADPH2:quinone reductase